MAYSRKLKIPLKWMIGGYPYCRTPPYVSIRWDHACRKVRPPTSKAFRPRLMGVIHCEDQSRMSMAYPMGAGIHRSKSWFDGGIWGVSCPFRFMMIWLAIIGLPLYGMQIICNTIYLILGQAPRIERKLCTCPYAKGQKTTHWSYLNIQCRLFSVHQIYFYCPCLILFW